VRQFSSNWSANIRNPTKIERTGAKRALSLYFRADFNNSSTILTRIVSQFRIYIQNWNPTSAVWFASFSKYVTKNWLLFEQFSSDFNDSHVNLTRIVSQIHSFFRNKNRTNVARTATILVSSNFRAKLSKEDDSCASFCFSLNYRSFKELIIKKMLWIILKATDLKFVSA
jgi:hypothetical protein